METKHIAFNPNSMTLMDSPLGRVCAVQEKEGWKLIEVIPHHAYESIAVFERSRIVFK